MMGEKSDRGIHILVECPELIASVRVAVLATLKPLEGAGLCAVRFRETRNIKKSDIAWCDVFICVRGSELATKQVILECRRLGRFVIYFLDDDLLNLPQELLSYQYFEYEGHRRSICQCLATSDVLWVVNDQIGRKYKHLCGGNRYIKTEIPACTIPLSQEEAGSTIRILYAGSQDHQEIIQDILRPAIKQILDTNSISVDFVCIGPDPDLGQYKQVHHIEYFSDYTEYRKFVESGRFDIALAPTRMGSFFQCKYYNKFVEYTSIGAVGIYTDCSLYQQVIKNEYNGVLAENDPAVWAEKIILLAKDQKLRHECLYNAYKLLSSEFNENIVAKSLVTQLPEIIHFRAPIITLNKIHLHDLRLYFYFDRIKYLFSQYGILAIPIIAGKAVKKIVKWCRKGLF